MVDPDVFVGSVAIGVGAVVVMASIFNWQWYYDLQKARWVESYCGRKGARIIFAIVGLVLIVLGSAIAVGFGVNRLRSADQGGSSTQQWHREMLKTCAVL